MKTISGVFRKAVSVVGQAVLLMVVLNACNQQDPVVSGDKYARARSGAGPHTNWLECPDGYHYDPAIHDCVPDTQDPPAQDCSPVINVQSIQRDKVVANYGPDGGTRFDQLRADQNPYDDISNFSSAVYSYVQQIQNAVRNAASIYSNSFGSCNTCTATYSSDAFLTEISNQINPIKNSINNDGALTDVQQSVLLAGIQAIYDNWDPVGGLVENHDTCYPNPAWYNYNNGVHANGFFSGLVKALKKVVNIIASVVVNIAVYAFNGAIIGALFSCAGQTEVSSECAAPGLAVGGAIGGLVGLVVGVVRVANGTYDACILPPCS